VETWAPNAVYTSSANANNNGYYGLYPFIRSGANIYDSSPWQWWDPAVIDQANSDNGFLTNPDMSSTKARTFIDTIQNYAAPRMMCALELAGSPCDANNVVEFQSSIKVYPNPSSGLFNVNLSVFETIRAIEVYDLTGKIVMEIYPNTAQVVLDLTSLTNGIYTLKIMSDGSSESVRLQKI
jgi:hypothetical protein